LEDKDLEEEKERDSPSPALHPIVPIRLKTFESQQNQAYLERREKLLSEENNMVGQIESAFDYNNPYGSTNMQQSNSRNVKKPDFQP
jgi:hypothetical protein